MIKLTMTTDWIGDGTEGDPQRPRVPDRMEQAGYIVYGWTDITGQAADQVKIAPNVSVIQINTDKAGAQAVYAAINNDQSPFFERYEILAVEAIDEDALPGKLTPDDPITQTDIDRIKALCVRRGIPLSKVRAKLGDDPQNRTRREIIDLIRGWLKRKSQI